jgi:hypothetical protein
MGLVGDQRVGFEVGQQFIGAEQIVGLAASDAETGQLFSF